MTDDLETIDQVEAFKNMLVAIARGSQGSSEYPRLRRELVRNVRIKARLPRFVRTCGSPKEFWGFIKVKFGTYHERENYLADEFRGLLTFLEDQASTPADAIASGVLDLVDSDHIQLAWAKALDRRETDPEGAITAARSLLESVCKHILDEVPVEYDGSLELPKLYRLVAENLNLSPSQHTEQVFRQVLGGCHSVVEGLGALRNKLSDAHGKSKAGVKPAPRHAALAVNLAGAMATFLIETWEVRRGGQPVHANAGSQTSA